MLIGTVAALARFPVKSMGGEPVAAAVVEARGVVADRLWAVYTADGGLGSGKTSKRFRRIDGLLDYRSWLAGDHVLLEGPDGNVLVAGDPQSDAALSALFDRPLTLRRESDVQHHDDSPVHLFTTAALRGVSALVGDDVDPRRFRANILVDSEGTGFPEDGWHDRQLAIGREVILRLGPGMPRCVMTSAAQRDLPADSRVLKSLGARPGVEFGLMVDVVRGGVIREGDEATLL